jgi:hypothetical protein
MAIIWTISTLERNTDDGVVVAHWRASDSEIVGEVEHTGSSYGTCSFTPDADADVYTAYADITEEDVIKWVKASISVDSIEESIAAQIAESKEPSINIGVPW